MPLPNPSNRIVAISLVMLLALLPNDNVRTLIWLDTRLFSYDTLRSSFALPVSLSEVTSSTLDWTDAYWWLAGSPAWGSRWYDPIVYRSIGSKPSEVAATLLTTESGNGRPLVSSDRIASLIWAERSWSISCKVNGSSMRRDRRWCLVKLALVKFVEGRGPSSGGGTGEKGEDMLERIDGSDNEGRSGVLWDWISSDCLSGLNHHQHSPFRWIRLRGWNRITRRKERTLAGFGDKRQIPGIHNNIWRYNLPMSSGWWAGMKESAQ